MTKVQLIVVGMFLFLGGVLLLMVEILYHLTCKKTHELVAETTCIVYPLVSSFFSRINSRSCLLVALTSGSTERM